jgi:hypothetical protein
VIARVPRIISYQSVRSTRVLASVLLLAIAWGATAEATHHHGSAVRGAYSHNGNAPVRPAIQSSGDQTGPRKSSTRNECLICQLHRHLFATALTLHLHETPTAYLSLRFTPHAISHQKQFTYLERGRAPPDFSLS